MVYQVSRRSVVLGATALVTASALRSYAQIDDPAFYICSTVPGQGDGLDIQDFSSSDFFINENEAGPLNITDYGVASGKKRWLPKHGLTPATGVVTLGFHFMNGSPAVRTAFETRAQAWIDAKLGQRVNFVYDLPANQSQIRVMFDGNGPNNSAIGTDAKSFRLDQPTMRIRDIESVQHECGHALCLLHEHSHPDFQAVFDEQAVIAEMAGPPNNWSEAKTRANILTPVLNGACVGDQLPNAGSVMLYNIPSTWTKNHVGIPASHQITQRDRNCLYALYKA